MTNHTFPAVATVEQIRDHCEWLISTGRGHYRMELRERYVAVIPRNEHAADDDSGVAFLVGVN